MPRPAGPATVAVNATLLPSEIEVGTAARLVVVAAAVTVMVTPAEVDAAKELLPEYAAVIVFMPIGSAVVARFAPPEPFNVPFPSVVLPFSKVTVPVGVPLPDAGATVAARITLVPAETVAREADNVVVVAPGSTWIIPIIP